MHSTEAQVGWAGVRRVGQEAMESSVQWSRHRPDLAVEWSLSGTKLLKPVRIFLLPTSTQGG